jgi:hypothetical protein
LNLNNCDTFRMENTLDRKANLLREPFSISIYYRDKWTDVFNPVSLKRAGGLKIVHLFSIDKKRERTYHFSVFILNLPS